MGTREDHEVRRVPGITLAQAKQIERRLAARVAGARLGIGKHVLGSDNPAELSGDLPRQPAVRQHDLGDRGGQRRRLTDAERLDQQLPDAVR